jgi:hypothetical protein
MKSMLPEMVDAELDHMILLMLYAMLPDENSVVPRSLRLSKPRRIPRSLLQHVISLSISSPSSLSFVSDTT